MKKGLKWIQGLKEAFKYSLSSYKRFLIFLFLSGFTFSIMALLSFPAYSAQMLQAGPGYWLTAVYSLSSNIYLNTGTTGLILTILFSLLTSVALINTYISLSLNTEISGNLAGLLPGVAASGCASCGVGILSLLGLTGVLSTLPFGGNLLRAGGVILIVFFLARNGDPSKCKA